MTRDQALDVVKRNIIGYLESQGIDLRKSFICLNPDHDDSHPSMRFDPERNKVHCFACSADYDLIDLIGIETGLEGKPLFDEAFRRYGISVFEPIPPVFTPTTKSPSLRLKNAPPKPEADFSDYYFKCQVRLQETSYLSQRGISEPVATRFNVGYDPNWKHPKAPNSQPSPRIIIPATNGSYFARALSPADAKENNSKSNVGPAALCNISALTEAKYCFVVEGAIDAMSIHEVGANAVALNSTANLALLLEAMKALPEKDRPTLILALDNDDPGRDATTKLEKALEAEGFSFYRPDDFYDSYKDANAMLCADRDMLLRKINEAWLELDIRAEAYREKNSVSAYLATFQEKIRQRKEAIPTGLKKLDNEINGGLHPGLIVLGAISSLGKTALALQIADFVAANSEEDCLFFSLEMSKDELIARSLSRLTLKHAKEQRKDVNIFAKSTQGILNPKLEYLEKDKPVLDTAWQEYASYANRLFIIETEGAYGTHEIRKAIRSHVMATGKRPICFVDYLQIIAPYDPRATDKQAVDNNVTELRRISRAFEIPVFVISAFNRNNYETKANMAAFKESGAIEYSADQLWAMQFEGAGNKDFKPEEAKSSNPREIELHILKNRNGQTGIKINLSFYPRNNYFECH